MSGELEGRNVDQNIFHTKLLHDYHIYHYKTVPHAPWQNKTSPSHNSHWDNHHKIVQITDATPGCHAECTIPKQIIYLIPTGINFT